MISAGLTDSETTADARAGRWALVGLLILMAGLRLILILRGGQFEMPDESRYLSGRESVEMLFVGRWREALAHPFATGEHVGFRLVSIVPALLERATGWQDVVPAVFFGLFSVGVVLQMAALVRDLGCDRAAQFWTLFAGATSVSLLYYSRHVQPYDLSMFLALLALRMGVRAGGAGPRRCLLAGFTAGWAFLVYYGYWPLVMIASCIGAAYPVRPVRVLVSRALAWGVGGILAAAIPVVIDRALGTGGMIRALQTWRSIPREAGFFDHLRFAGYLWQAERFWIVAALIAAGGLVVLAAGRARARNFDGALRTAVVGAGAAAALVFLLGNVLIRYPAYARLARQLTPFAGILLGVGLARMFHTVGCALVCLAIAPEERRRVAQRGVASAPPTTGQSTRYAAFKGECEISGPGPRAGGRRALWAWAVATLLLINLAWCFWQNYAIVFHRQFVARWLPFLVERTQASEAGYYHRFVNAEHYIFEAETLRTPPVETIASAPHMFQYGPYLYEFFVAPEQRRRRSIDHRLRLVKMAVEPSARITGRDHGLVTLEVSFAGGRGGFVEPLLSLGPRGAGEVFFVQYLTDTLVRFGMESMGDKVLHSEPVEVTLGRNHRLDCFSGSLLAPAPDPVADAGIPPATLPLFQRFVWMGLDGRELISGFATPHGVRPEQVFAGVNVAGAALCGAQFSGAIRGAARGGLPPPPEGFGTGAYGAVRIVFSPPPPVDGQPEPLLTMGEPGRAVLGFAIPQADGRVRFGFEIWGVGAWSSQPVKLKSAEENEAVLSFGALYPPVGHPAWGPTPLDRQKELKGRLRIEVNGQAVFDRAAETPELGEAIYTVGRNSVGGSYVGAAFSGKVSIWGRTPFP